MKLREGTTGTSSSLLFDRLRSASVAARKLFAVIVREAYHGPIQPKAIGTATPPEILEACGLDVGDFYVLLEELKAKGLIQVSNAYPFEEITLSPDAAEAESLAERCQQAGIPLEGAFVNLVLPAGNRADECA